MDNILSILKNRWVYIVVIVVIVAAIFLINFDRYNISIFNISKDWAVKEACKEVKAQLLEDYGEIATTQGSILYSNDQDYIVVVRYELPELNWKGSVACYVYGYSADNCHVKRITKEMSYDYAYDKEYMKTFWAID